MEERSERQKPFLALKGALCFLLPGAVGSSQTTQEASSWDFRSNFRLVSWVGASNMRTKRLECENGFGYGSGNISFY